MKTWIKVLVVMVVWAGNATAQTKFYSKTLGTWTNAEAVCRWGTNMMANESRPLDRARARQAVREAADSGYKPAQWALVDVSKEDGLKYLGMLADHGDAYAMYRLGALSMNGTLEGYQKAMVCFRKAAAQGNREGAAAVGRLYHEGRGAKQNTAEALRWYVQSESYYAAASAAWGNLPKAEYYKWWCVAKVKAKDTQRAGQQDGIAELTPEELQAGEKLAAEYLKQRYGQKFTAK